MCHLSFNSAILLVRIKCVLLAATLVTNPQYEMDSDYDKNSRPSEYLIRKC